MTPLAIGIDFGGTSVKLGIVEDDKVIHHAARLNTPDYDSPEALLKDLVLLITEAREQFPRIAAIGMGMPGFVNFKKGSIHQLTNVPGWDQFPLKDTLYRDTLLPVVVDNDANAMAYAEWQKGAGQGFSNLIALTLGTGVGGGLIINGQMHRGSRFGAGELGQMSIDYKGRPGQYQNKGALEDYIGNREFQIEAAKCLQQAGLPLTDTDPKSLADLAQSGNEIAIQLWDQMAEKLANVLMSSCWLLNPEAIVIGGGIAQAGELLFTPLKKHLFAQLSPPFKDHLQILPARFGNEAGMIGCATLALQEAGLDPDPS